MGLDVSHDAWSGAYSRFNRFRVAVGKAAGVDYPEGIGDDIISFPIDYKDTNPGLYEFFCHSDCDGEISPDLCRQLANEMEAILPLIRGEDFPERAVQFILGCRDAAEANEPLEFM